ncbi:hypothetical protein D3C86_1461720 [compost metagenome]
MVAHGVHDAAEQKLVFGSLRGVGLHRAIGVQHAQPARGRQFGRAVGCVPDLVRRVHAGIGLAAVGVGQADVVVQIGGAGLHRHAHAVQQRHERIRFQREALGLGVLVQRIAHGDRHQPFEIGFFQEVMQERLIGAAKARLDAGLLQTRLRRAAGLHAFEQPAFHDRAAPGRRQVGVRPGIQRAVKRFFQQRHTQYSFRARGAGSIFRPCRSGPGGRAASRPAGSGPAPSA